MDHAVFISYASEDIEVAGKLRATLTARGIPCWMAPGDIPFGADYRAAIIRAIDCSGLMLLVFSSRSNSSRDVTKEVSRADRKTIPIIPLRIEEVEPSGAMVYLLEGVQWLDALTPPLEDHLERLAEDVLRLIPRPEVEAEPQAPVTNDDNTRLASKMAELEERIAPKLEFTLGKGELFCALETNLPHHVGVGMRAVGSAAAVMPKENEMLFRVGIRNRGAITIEQVSVKLEDIRPQPQGLGIPLTLHPKDDHYRSEFPLHGGQTEHIDLFLKRDEVGQPRKGYFVICHVAAGERRESAFAVGQYAVTLSASGQNTRTCEGQFNIDVDAHGSTKISEIR